MVNNAEALDAVWHVVQCMHNRGDSQSLNCINAEEKMLHMSLVVPPPFKFQDYFTAFIQKINKLIMSRGVRTDCTVREQREERASDLKLFAKAVGLLQQPQLPLEEHVLGRLKVLTFNNLACFYKQHGKYNLALSSVNHALAIEEHMLAKEKYDIIPTYLNKVAIYSDMGKHKDALYHLAHIQKHLATIDTDQTQVQKKRYSLYMNMLVLYNFGVEHEHLSKLNFASQYFEEAKAIAIQISNGFMLHKLEKILQELKK